MTKERLIHFVLICICAFAGGMVSEQLFKPSRSVAAPGVYDASSVENGIKFFYDPSGKTRMDIGVTSGQPVQDFYGEDGKPRLQLGTYSGDVRSNEKGLPVITLYDNQAHLKMLLRLDGKNQSPLLILKDNQSHDRLIMGLAMEGSGEEPFLAYFDKDGKKHMAFGDY